MVPKKISKQWQRWVQEEIGGPQDRIAAVTVSIERVLADKEPQASVVAVAYQSAADWDSQNGSARLSEEDPSSVSVEAMEQWRGWAAQAIGGPKERIESAIQAISVALEQPGNTQNEIVMAAGQAAAQWDLQYQTERPTSLWAPAWVARLFVFILFLFFVASIWR